MRIQNKKYGHKSRRQFIIFVGLLSLLFVYIHPLQARNNSSDFCKKALSCYSSMVSSYGDKNTTQLSRKKQACDRLKERCEQLKRTNKKSSSFTTTLQQAYDDYQQAFERYTSLATTSNSADPADVQKALEKYRSSYAQYKKLKDAQQGASSKPEKNITRDTSGVDGIVDIDPSDVENNIEYIEGLKQRSTAKEISQKDKIPLKVRKANPVLSKTESFPVIPMSKRQIFTHSDDIIVTVPPNFTTKNQSLTISRAAVDRSIEFKGATPLALFDVTLDNGKQPLKPVDISVSYNPDQLDPHSSPEEQLAALRWDEERGMWVNLPVSIDIKNHTVSALADHFTLFGWVIIAARAVEIGTDVGERLLNDAYQTPQKNFRILYSKKEINQKSSVNDYDWKLQFSGSGIKYDKNHPRYIQDMGYFLEKALSTYTKKYKFKNPAGKKKSWFKSYQKTINVKIDSYMAQLSGDPYYEKIFKRIHLPISYVLEPSGAKTTTAHELFHVIQGEYYGKLGLARATSLYRLWWLEATAEYAAHDIAWPHYSKEMTNYIGSNYLTFPIDDTGSKKSTGHGWSNSPYEYKTSVWIKYVVDNGADLRKMIESDVSDYSLSIKSMENYLRDTQKKSMDDFYRNFAHWMVFSNDGALHKFPIASFGTGKNPIAVKEDKLELGSGKETSYTFKMPNHYTSKLWAIEIDQKEKDSDKPDWSLLDKKLIKIKVDKISHGSVVDVFIISKNLRNPSSLKPVTSIFTKNTSKLLSVNVGDLVCITTTQGSSTNGNAEVVVSDAGITLEIDPPELSDVRPREANYFTISAKNIPKEIEKVRFEWDYNDSSEKGIHDFVVVSEGEAKQKISHRYKESDKEEIFPLKVILKDANKNMVLAEAEASITIPLASTSVGLEVVAKEKKVKDNIKLIAYIQVATNESLEIMPGLEGLESVNVEAHDVYPGFDIYFVVNVDKPDYTYQWKINGANDNSAGKYGKWGHSFWLKTADKPLLERGVIGKGANTISVTVYDKKGVLVGGDSWTVNIKDTSKDSYLVSPILPDGDE